MPFISENKLEEALVAAVKNPAAAPDFYRLLLESDLLVLGTVEGQDTAGGKFSLVGSMIGALIIQTLTYTIYSLGVPPEVNMVVKSIVVFVVCISQSSEFKNILRRSA